MLVPIFNPTLIFPLEEEPLEEEAGLVVGAVVGADVPEPEEDEEPEEEEELALALALVALAEEPEPEPPE